MLKAGHAGSYRIPPTSLGFRPQVCVRQRQALVAVAQIAYTRAIQEAEAIVTRATDARAGELARAVQEGTTVRGVAAATGLSHQRVSQILSGQAPAR